MQPVTLPNGVFKVTGPVQKNPLPKRTSPGTKLTPLLPYLAAVNLNTCIRLIGLTEALFKATNTLILSSSSVLGKLPT